MNKKLSKKIKSVPAAPGVYLYRDKNRKVIYVGKAINLKKRVSSYFQKKDHDYKTLQLVSKISNLDFIKTESELEALILEADLIKRYKPRYNIRLKDDKNYVYLKITKEDYPRVLVTRQIADSNAEYLGPYTDASAVRSLLKMSRKIFPFCTCLPKKSEVCLYYHIGLCLGHSENYVSKNDYKKSINGLKRLFSGKVNKINSDLKKEMKLASLNKEFEKAAELRDKIKYLKKIQKTNILSERDISIDSGLAELRRHLSLADIPKKIESFDISNIMGTAAVGSMVVFRNGVSSAKEYRRFQIRTVKSSNDFAMMAEVLARRFKKKGKDMAFSDMPELVILDGGKGQLSAVLENIIVPEGVKVIALAKKNEEIFTVIGKQKSRNRFEIINLSKDSEGYYLVQRIRDEAHRFAVSYHRKVKTRDTFNSSLDSIIGVGPITKKKLISKFGSIDKIKKAKLSEISKIVPVKIAKKIKEQL